MVARKAKQSPSSYAFAPGDAVRIDDREAFGHCRTPWYLRGKTGVVAHVHGAFRDAEKLAYHKPGQPKRVLYKVRLNQTEIWPDYGGPVTDTLETDIYEHWLSPVAKTRTRKKP
jgi:nitrile hydratase subunit beta